MCTSPVCVLWQILCPLCVIACAPALLPKAPGGPLRCGCRHVRAWWSLLAAVLPGDTAGRTDAGSCYPLWSALISGTSQGAGSVTGDGFTSGLGMEVWLPGVQPGRD